MLFSWAIVTIFLTDKGMSVLFHHVASPKASSLIRGFINYRLKYLYRAKVRRGEKEKKEHPVMLDYTGEIIDIINGARYIALIGLSERGVIIKRIAPISEFDAIFDKTQQSNSDGAVVEEYQKEVVENIPIKPFPASQYFYVDISSIKRTVQGTLFEIVDKLIVFTKSNPGLILKMSDTRWYIREGDKDYQVRPEIPYITSDYVDSVLRAKGFIT